MIQRALRPAERKNTERQVGLFRGRNLDKGREVKEKRNRLGKLGEDGTKGVSHSGTERGTSSKSSESYGPRLGRRECVGQYTELGMGNLVKVEIWL